MKAAVVGLGIGHAHCAAYLESAEAELVAVCDRMPERLARVAGTFEAGSMGELRQLYAPDVLDSRWEDLGVRTCTSPEQLLADESIRIISLCTPDDTHAEWAVRILAAGKHLLMEKPLALSLQEAERIGDVLASAPGTFAVDYEFRLNPAIRKLRSLVADGILGDVQAFTLYHFRRPFKRDKWRRWIQYRRSSGGLIVEETSHWLDLLRFITAKEVAELSCRSADGIHRDFDYEDIAFIQGSLDGGGIFQISHALSGFDFSLNLTVHGSEATAWCHLKDGARSSLDGGQTSYRGLVAWAQPGCTPGHAHTVEYGTEVCEPYNIREYVKHFAACAASGKRPPAGYEEALEALRLALWARDGRDK